MSARKFSVVGRSVKRTDMLEKVTGAAQYAGDLKLPGMLFGRIKRSTIAHANIKRIDASKALALPGVKAVLTHESVPRVLHYGSPHPRAASVTKDQYILDTKVRYWGDGVAAVAATSEEVAEEALDLIEVEYEPLPAVFTVEDAEKPGAPQIHDNGLERNLVVPPCLFTRGDIDKGFAEAEVVVEGWYALGRPTPAYMEPNVCVAQWDGAGKLTFWTSTQSAFMVRGTLSEVLGVPLAKVRVLCDHMGGGFGAKQDIYQHELLCVLLARQTRRPVRMELTRKETFLGGRTRHAGRIWLKQGFKRDGTITARQAECIFDSGAYGSHAPGVTAVGTSALTSLFRCENVHLAGRAVYTNAPIAGAFRGYGVVQTYYALDIQMDEAAEKLGMDPAELKLMNACREGDQAPSGHGIVGYGLADCIREGMRLVGWKGLRTRNASPSPTGGGVGVGGTSGPGAGASPHPSPLPAEEGNKAALARVRGWGMGCEMHGSSAYPGIKEQGNAFVKMNEDGSVTLLTGAAGLGTGAHTALSQIVAEELGLKFEDVSVVHGDTDVAPWDIGAFASHTTYMVGTAAKMAAAEVRQKLLERAADRLEVSPADLEIEGSFIGVRGVPGRGMTVRECVEPKPGGIPAAHFMGSGTYMPTKSYSFGAHFVEVEVDTDTGQIDVLQVVPVHEIGKVIHPVAAAGQIEGGIQQGIGHTLSENYEIDPRDGRSLNPSFVDYKMPLSMDMPVIRTVILETAPDPGGPWGAKGVGEDPIIAIGPAIANAVYDAIGVRFRHYPITPEDVLKALDAAAS